MPPRPATKVKQSTVCTPEKKKSATQVHTESQFEAGNTAIALIKQANKLGGRDNITVIVIDF